MMNTQTFEWGQKGECFVRQWLTRHGFYVLAASNIADEGAPKMRGHLESLIAPDIQASQRGKTLWFDVKAKARSVTYGKLGRRQTGCALRHYHAYQAVAAESGIPCGLVFIHVETSDLCIGLLSNLDYEKQVWDPGHAWFKANPSHPYKEAMVYFPLTAFDRYDVSDWEAFKDLSLSAVAPKTVRAWEPRRTAMRHGEIRRAITQPQFNFCGGDYRPK